MLRVWPDSLQNVQHLNSFSTGVLDVRASFLGYVTTRIRQPMNLTLVARGGSSDAASGCHYCSQHLFHRGVLLAMAGQCGTVCQQHCKTVACHYIHIQAATENALICSMMNTVRRCCRVLVSLASLYRTLDLLTYTYMTLWGGSVAEWLACWTQGQKGLSSNRSRDAVG